MRLQIEPKLMQLMRHDENAELRQCIKILRENLYPEWATEAKDRAGEYHFIADDILVAYRVDDESEMETVIQIVMVDESEL